MTERTIIHKDGLPIRLNGQLRGVVTHPVNGLIISDIIKNSPHIGSRCERDTLRNNFEENSRLRKIARHVSRELVHVAEDLGLERFCTVVHGSVARGLVRAPDCSDPSDIDIDLVVDDAQVSKHNRDHIRWRFFRESECFGNRIDTYVWDIDQMRSNSGQYARLYISSSAYPIHNTGALWDEIFNVGVENQIFLASLSQKQKRLAKEVLKLAIKGQNTKDLLKAKGESGNAVEAFLLSRGIHLGCQLESAIQYARIIMAEEVNL